MTFQGQRVEARDIERCRAWHFSGQDVFCSEPEALIPPAMMYSDSCLGVPKMADIKDVASLEQVAGRL